MERARRANLSPSMSTDRPLRALFVNENLGGHRTLHLHLERALAERDDVDATFVHVAPPRLLRRVAAAPVPGLGRLDLDLQPLRYQVAASMSVARDVRRLLPATDVVHVYSENAALAFPRLLGQRPTVVSTDCTNLQNAFTIPYRDPTRFTNRALALTRRLENAVYREAMWVVAQSDWAAASLHDDYGVAPERLQVIRFGITMPPAARHRDPELPQITFVGTSMAKKGGWELLQFHQRELRGRALLNLITHDDVDDLPGVRVYRDVRPGDGRVAAILARTTVFAFPSVVDKSSYAVVEALAAGVPAVVYGFGAQPEIVEDGVCGFVVRPGDKDSFAQALVRLLDHPELAERMGAAARRRAVERFDARKTTAELVDLFRDAVARFNGPGSPGAR